MLLVNKPLVDASTGALTFTVTQPRVPLTTDLEDEKHYRGGKLDYEYLERVPP